MHDGTAAPPLSDDDRPASRHQIIGRWGLTGAVAAAVLFVALGALAAGLHANVSSEAWAWGRAILVTAIVIGLVVAGFGYGVDSANRRGVLIVRAVEDSRTDMHADHRALHLENCALRDRVADLEAGQTRILAFEEQRSHLLTVACEELTALRKDHTAVHALLAQICLHLPPDQRETGRRDATWMADMAESLRIGREIEQRRPQQP